MTEEVTISLVLGATPFVLAVKSYIKAMFKEIKESVKRK